MTRVGFEPTVSVFKQSKIFRASYCSATVIGFKISYELEVVTSQQNGRLHIDLNILR
jgi:hypothetical protein